MFAGGSLAIVERTHSIFNRLLMFSRVPNKRGGGENNQGGLEMVRYNNNPGGGWNNLGEGCLEK